MSRRQVRGVREADDPTDQQEPDEGGQEEAAEDTEEVERPVRLEIESDDTENEENLHERMHRLRHQQSGNQHQHQHHPHHHHHHHQHHGHVKEMIKSDRSIRVARGPSPVGQPPAAKIVATAVDEEQLHQRLMEAKSSEAASARRHSASRGSQTQPNPLAPNREQPPSSRALAPKSSSRSASSSSSSSTSSTLRSAESDGARSPPPAVIIIPASVAKSLSARASSPSGKSPGAPGAARSATQTLSSTGPSSPSSGATITREQLEYGPLLRNGEVQVLYRNPEADNRTVKDEEAKRVAPGQKQSPIAIMSMNPTYGLVNKALVIEYPATVENLRLNNTGFSWEVKIPYQISMVTALYGAHLNQAHRFRLDQFHCHWGERDELGSEHTVDNRAYSAELHFVHYNMEKYHSMAKAARHPDGLVVVSVFLDAQSGHHNHAELEKIVSHLRAVSLKGEHSIIKQAIRIENLLPANRSYWSYQGSLTTPPYFESVTWFVLKQPIKCSVNQIQRFRNLNSSLRSEDETLIRSNHRATQPLNGRTIVNYDEPRSR